MTHETWFPPLAGDQPNEPPSPVAGTTDSDDVPLFEDKPQKRYRVDLTETVSYEIYVDVDADATREEIHQRAIDDHIDGLSVEVDSGPVEVEYIYPVKAP